MAYQRHLQKPHPGLFEPETLQYFGALQFLGRHDEVLRTAKSLADQHKLGNREAFLAAKSALKLGQDSTALALVIPLAESHPEEAETQAQAAILEARTGQSDSARQRCRECARLGLDDLALLKELLPLLGLSRAEFSSWAKESRPSIPARKAARRLFRKDPGYRLRPSPVLTPHTYGGTGLNLPSCPVCQHLTRLFFKLSVPDLPNGTLLPGWMWYPLLGCTDCLNWLARRDYRMEGERVTLLHLEGDPLTLAEGIHDASPAVAVSYARLVPTDPDDPRLWNKPQVGGAPDWVQDPEAVFCKLCKRSMVFIASMATSAEFEPEVFINNGSGYQYHFACATCRTIAVLGQWT